MIISMRRNENTLFGLHIVYEVTNIVDISKCAMSWKRLRSAAVEEEICDGRTPQQSGLLLLISPNKQVVGTLDFRSNGVFKSCSQRCTTGGSSSLCLAELQQ